MVFAIAGLIAAISISLIGDKYSARQMTTSQSEDAVANKEIATSAE